MNSEEKKYFETLREDHLKHSETLHAPSMEGILEVMSNLYRDDAHFVYELIQNADDQKATYIKFILSHDRLIFIHNAKKHFTISNPKTHKDDRLKGKLGDVNSILSIASSSKTGKVDDFPIGKFGLGFKSVFQYTDCPRIYDENFRFSITDYIVPNLLETDHPLREHDKTLFDFPLKASKGLNGYKEIKDKFKGLNNPLLFLNNITKIDWETDDENGWYKKTEIGTIGSGKILEFEVSTGEETSTSIMWKFSNFIPNYNQLYVSVVFIVDKDKHVINTSTHYPLYCYLPTANDTMFPVIMHAPFKLTGNRESIVAKDTHNINMVQLLGGLLASSLNEICFMGESEKEPWIDNNIIDFLPEVSNVHKEFTTGSLDLTPIVEAIQTAIRNGQMLWCEQRCEYLSTSDGYIPDGNYLPEIYPAPLLSNIMEQSCGWVLTSLDGKTRKDAEMAKLLGVKRLNPEKILRRITSDMLTSQNQDWLKKWYISLSNVKYLWKNGPDSFLRYKEIILTSNGDFKAPFILGNIEPNVHLPKQETGIAPSANISIVETTLFKDDNVKDFFVELGLKEVDDFTLAELIYLPKITDENAEIKVRLDSLAKFADIYLYKLTDTQKNKLWSAHLSVDKVFPAILNGSFLFTDSRSVKRHNADNDFFFSGNNAVSFFEPDSLTHYLEDDAIRLISRLIEKIPESSSPTVRRIKIAITSENECKIPKGAQRPASYNRKNIDIEYFEDEEIVGLSHFVHVVSSNTVKRASEYLVSLLNQKSKEASYHSCYYGAHQTFPMIQKSFEIIKNATWIDIATPELKRILGLPVNELQKEELEVINSVLSSSGITSKADVEGLLDYLKREDIIECFQLKQGIERQKEVVKANNPFTLQWLEEILNLRLRYVEAKEKQDIEILIQALLDAIQDLDKDKNSDLREELPYINILFGPPGTGKTSEIANIVVEEIRRNPNTKILILTPTNAAANVVADRINKKGVAAYRGINSSNNELRQQLDELCVPIYDASIDAVKSIIVSTVHYFSREYSCIEQQCLHNLRWDSIIIDEASMVTLDYVLLALFKGHQYNSNCAFYIVGDPLQLPAITNLDPFILEDAQLDEFNFFSFIGLNKFSENPKDMPETIRQRINIRLLKKQYRSVTPLCELTSRFAYGDQIESERKDTTLRIPDNALSIFNRPLSFVRFPVTSYDENPKITNLDKLRGSNFNIYSALIVKESLQHLFNQLRENRFEQPLKIGIITPYSAQRVLIEKLLNAKAISRPASVEVFVNTVHQFQGDEFDIVMLVLNPPNVKMSPKDNILINKHYIINVAISRAKDCLVILYPDNSCSIENFLHINKNGATPNIESIAEIVFNTDIKDITVSASDIEKVIFGNPEYLAKNCEVTFHEEINFHEHTKEYIYKFVKGGNTIDILYSNQSSL